MPKKVQFRFMDRFNIGSRTIGYREPVFIIAEAGVAHFGSLEKAKRLVDLAVHAGADAIKFQIFKTDNLISVESQEWRTRMKTRELSYDAFTEIKRYCDGKGIIFFATAHDGESLDFLDTLDVPAYKVGSGEVKNWAFIRKVAERGKPVLISTGMYTMEDVASVLKVVMEAGNANIALLYCVTRYPTPPSEVNLRVIETFRNTFKVITGYSDHTKGFHFPLAAVVLGASIIEKHIALDFNVPNAQDWKVSCSSADFLEMVRQIREIEVGLGSGIKVLSEAEKGSLKWASKSLVAAVDIMAGETITFDKLCTKRPGNGILPTEINKVVGKKARIRIKVDTIIKKEHLL